MRTARAIAIIGGVALTMLLPAVASADEKHPYLLNCRLMEKTDPIYQRLCKGEKDLYVSCSDKVCILVNYKSQFFQGSVSFASDGSDNVVSFDNGRPDRVVDAGPGAPDDSGGQVPGPGTGSGTTDPNPSEVSSVRTP